MLRHRAWYCLPDGTLVQAVAQPASEQVVLIYHDCVPAYLVDAAGVWFVVYDAHAERFATETSDLTLEDLRLAAAPRHAPYTQ